MRRGQFIKLAEAIKVDGAEFSDGDGNRFKVKINSVFLEVVVIVYLDI